VMNWSHEATPARCIVYELKGQMEIYIEVHCSQWRHITSIVPRA
jgi:hypothetical protein